MKCVSSCLVIEWILLALSTEAFIPANVYQAGRSDLFLASEFRSQYWISDDKVKDLEILYDIPDDATEVTKQDEAAMVIRQVIYNNKNSIVGFEIANAITETDAKAIQTLASNIRSSLSSQFNHRSFGEGMGGNDVTYLAPILQHHMPRIAKTVVKVAQMAFENADVGWEIRPDSLGIRTSEHLSYDGWKSLEAHKDVGSVYTVMIALKDPSDYVGGEFFLQKSFLDQEILKPCQLSAVVFLSDTVHGVQSITGGQRESFVTELWAHDDCPLGMNRPTPDEWDAFLMEQKEVLQ